MRLVAFRIIHTLGTVLAVTNDRFNKSAANDRIGKRECISIYHALDVLIGSCPVEGSIFINTVLSNLHIGRQSRNELVERIDHKTQQVANGNFAFNLFEVVAKGVHHGEQNDFHVRIHLQNGIQSAGIVQYQRNSNVEHYVYKIGICNVLFKSGLQFIEKLHHTSLHFRFALTKNIFVVVVLVSFAFLEADDFKDSAEAENAKVAVTNRKGDYVSLSNVFLIVLSDNSDLFCHRVAIVTCSLICNSLREFNELFVVFTTCVCLIVGHTGDVSKGCVDTGVVDNFVNRPIVAAREVFVPLCLIPNFVLLVVFSNEFVKNSDYFRIVVIEFKEPVDILSTDTGHSELCVGNISGGYLTKVFFKNVCIRLIAIVCNTGVVVVTIKTVTVGHRVTKRYVVKIFFFGSSFVVVITNCRHNSRSKHCKKQSHSQQNRKKLNTYILSFHCKFLSDVGSSDIHSMYKIFLISM